MYIVRKGDNRINLPDKKSATDLVFSLTILGCSDPISTQHIIGNKQDIDRFEVVFLDKAVVCMGQHDAETVANWMLSLGCRKVGIEKLEESNEATE